MKHSRILSLRFLSVILTLLFLAGCVSSGGGNTSTSDNTVHEGPPLSPQSAARQGLQTLAKLVNAENFKAMGFDSVEESKNTTLGVPLKVFLVRLDKLRVYNPATASDNLLTDVNRVIFPVMVGDKVKCSIEVGKESGSGVWKATNYGDADRIRKIDQLRRKGLPVPAAEAEQIIVHVAFLNAYFFGQKSENRLILTNLYPLHIPRFSGQVTLRMEEVFSLLAPVARSHNGLPA